ncbi:D-alanyl-D-alanine carboxypeptidase family protein [Yinghuangia sp. ASG 101]|uniref:D-alanyl-D-alanine carboxypeptidase family protein n=1 Tax=Yinghuangia sp. ASG 101 TaxID=2896848 RepID=UPI001E2B02A5|nr:D-alanyl-D-alanine carboxypeptidase family protein [Yinghuangia sp. ASG 101]UGQ10204.1 D-alanyl-D-alanine carboxypeptidase family protein [Yinghuangia sp. ASG 101]
MTHNPQDQGPQPGGSRHRAGGTPEPAQGAQYSDAARYLDDVWQASSGAPAPNPFESPTQVVPVQLQPAPGQVPVPPAPTPAAGGDGRADEHDLGAYAMAAGAGRPPEGGPGGPDQPGAAPGGFAVGGAEGGGPNPPAPGGGHGGDEGGRAPRRNRRSLVVWSVLGVVLLGGAGVVAAGTLGDNDDTTPNAVNVGTPSPLPTPPPAPTPPATTEAPPTSAAATSASPTPSASASTSPTASKSPTASPSASGKSPTADKDNDGVTDEPESTDPGALAPAARTAYAQAKNAMAADGITMTLTSGKRSYQHQKELWEKEVRDLGSEEAARMRVLPPDESTHVHGTAIDINVAAQPWMKQNGSRYGWCQIYANESWHFEYDASYKNRGCPSLKPHP